MHKKQRQNPYVRFGIFLSEAIALCALSLAASAATLYTYPQDNNTTYQAQDETNDYHAFSDSPYEARRQAQRRKKAEAAIADAGVDTGIAAPAAPAPKPRHNELATASTFSASALPRLHVEDQQVALAPPSQPIKNLEPAVPPQQVVAQAAPTQPTPLPWSTAAVTKTPQTNMVVASADMQQVQPVAVAAVPAIAVPAAAPVPTLTPAPVVAVAPAIPAAVSPVVVPAPIAVASAAPVVAPTPVLTPPPPAAPVAEVQMVSIASETKTLATLSPAAGNTSLVASADQPQNSTLLALPPVSAPTAESPMMPAATTMPVPKSAVVAPTTDAAAMSAQSKQIVDRLPPEKIKPSKPKPPINMDHSRKNVMEQEEEVRHEGVGLKISVRRPKADINHMLEDAYDDLMAGNQTDAIELYKGVLKEQPNNKLALFGLATTYHRAGQIQLARPLYGQLLAIDPTNKEGLNNFLVLLADESPKEALVELDKLETARPEFSPIPAQMAIIYEKMGDYTKAVEYMNHAMELSPENMKYRYDLAIMLDKQGAWSDAATLYQQLLTASERGEKIPTDSEEIQERLTFIRSNRPKS